MATDSRPNESENVGATPLDSALESKPPDREPVAVPPPEPPYNDLSSGDPSAMARFEQSQAAYKQRQERFKVFGVEGMTDRYRVLPTREPALHIDPFLLQHISVGLYMNEL